MAWEVDHTKGITPHPVPLPMGEGTVLNAPGVIQASLLPWGGGQDEGRLVQNLAGPQSICRAWEA
jgi:hypothetical protein